MSEDTCPTLVVRRDGSRTDFQEYLVRNGAPADVEGVDLGAARSASPGPGVLDALNHAEVVLICPSNPIVSIGTILALPGVREALARRRDAVAVSPIIGGRPVKGPADRLIPTANVEVSALGVAELYRDICAGIVVDRVDHALKPQIEALGLRTRDTETLMRDSKIAAELAQVAMELAGDSS